MSATLALTALLMGLAGGPHCAAMCGAACSGVVRAGATPTRSMAMFQLGRLSGYAAAGAAAGFAVQSFGWLTTQTAALRPVWSLFHLAVLAWGLSLLVLARQPAWAQSAGKSVWARVRPLAQARGGVFGAGALWFLMPCGLLYSALLVASLSGGAWQGALSMALFAIGSGVSLGAFPALLRWLRRAGNGARKDWGTRAGGLVLAVLAAAALWGNLVERVALWCATF
jgi:sulfite exporter TauE/SafE